MTNADELTTRMWQAVAGSAGKPGVRFSGDGAVPSAFAATEFAAASIATAGCAVARLVEVSTSCPRDLIVDRELASAWFARSLRPVGWELEPIWDPLAGDYETADGWVRLHTNAPHHRLAAVRSLACAEEPTAVAEAVRHLTAEEVETVVVEAGGCAAALHSFEEWSTHEQGLAVPDEPLVDVELVSNTSGHETWQPDPGRPLSGVRVLDLTRVLAGPAATRFLAGFGADVLRIDPPTWDEATAPETTLGKRCARLDAKSPTGLAQLRTLISGSDVLIHGYRPGALEALGLGADEREAIRPGLIDVCLDAYGWHGPWRQRRGFDSLVQMSIGIADAGRIWAGSERPTPLPFQALDHATGYLMATAAVHGLTERLLHGRGLRARCSLARTGLMLLTQTRDDAVRPTIDVRRGPTSHEIEQTSWGPAKRVRPPLQVEGAPLRWDRPAVALGSNRACWTADTSATSR
jgi:hypothetical protein